MSELPPGFVLDQPAAPDASGLPEGFVLDQAEKPPSSLPFIGSGGLSWSGLVKGLYETAKGGAEYTHDVIAGKIDPLSEEGIGKAVDMSLLAMPLAPTRLTTQGLQGVSRAAQEATPFYKRGPAVEPPPIKADITVTPGRAAVEQGGRLGIDVPTFVASDSRAVQAAGQASRQLPLAGGIIEKAADRFTADLEGGVGKVANSMTEKTGLDKAALGDHLRGTLEKAVDNIDEVNHGAYAGFRDLIEPSKPVKEALAPIQDAFSKILPERMAAGEQKLGKLQPIANLLQVQGGPTFNGLQRARSQISKAIKFDSREGGFEAGDLKQMRAALTEAMDIASRSAAKGDPAAASSAWRMADQTFSQNVESLGSLGRALKSPSDEALLNQVLTMGAERGGNANRLVALHKQIGVENMQTLGAHVLEQAGRTPEGWSAAKFTTNIGKLSNTAKSLFFPQTRAQVEDLFGLAARWKEQEAKFANRSNTGRAALGGAAVGSTVATFFMNPMMAVAKVAASAGAGVSLGMLLSRPATANAAVQLARASEKVAVAPTPANINAFYAIQRRLASATARSFPATTNNSPTRAQPIGNHRVP